MLSLTRFLPCLILFAGVAVSAQQAESRPDLTPDKNGKLSQEQMRELLRVVAEKDLANQKHVSDYTYTEREVEKSLDGKGAVKSTGTKTYEIVEIEGEQVNRLVAKDDRPLDEKDAAKEDEKIKKIVEKREGESEEERRKREEKEAKQREEDRKFVLDVADAYDFRLEGKEAVDGREAWVISAEPRPGFEPKVKESKFLSKFHGRVWIDQQDLQLSRMDVEAIDTVSIGLVLARIHKGTRFILEQARVNNEVWLPRHVTFSLDARVALVKGYRVSGEQIFSDYKKFVTSANDIGGAGASTSLEQK